jgi:hypothetical protein
MLRTFKNISKQMEDILTIYPPFIAVIQSSIPLSYPYALNANHLNLFPYSVETLVSLLFSYPVPDHVHGISIS